MEMKGFPKKLLRNKTYLYRCTVHTVVYLITNTNKCTYIYIYII